MRAFPLMAVLTVASVMACEKAPPERIRVDGSPGVLPMVKEIGAAFERSDSSYVMVYGEGLSSTKRLEALANDSIDIALASHGVDSTELAGRGMTVHHIADVPVGFAVNSGVSVTNLTDAQVCDIYRGRIRNWKELGGPDLAIVPVTRPKGEVDGDVMMAGLPCLAALTMAPSVVTQQLPADMANHLSDTPGAIGMMSATMVSVTAGKTRAISLNSVAPTPDNLANRTYPHLRHSYLVVRQPAPPRVQAFLNYLASPAGEEILRGRQAVRRGH